MLALRDLGQTRNDFAASAVNQTGAEKVLDIGCGYGNLLAALDGQEKYGVDMDPRALQAAEELVPDARIVHQTGSDLPFEAGQFDVAVLSEVIEHVGDRNKQAVIDEAHRVLRPGGTLVFTCPYASVFAWVDPLDFKRRLPGLYALYSRVSGHEPQTAVEIGHKHLGDREIEDLFRGHFEILERRYTGPVTVWLFLAQAAAESLHLPRRLIAPLNRLRGWESGIRCPRWLAFSVRIVAQRM